MLTVYKGKLEAYYINNSSAAISNWTSELSKIFCLNYEPQNIYTNVYVKKSTMEVLTLTLSHFQAPVERCLHCCCVNPERQCLVISLDHQHQFQLSAKDQNKYYWIRRNHISVR